MGDEEADYGSYMTYAMGMGGSNYSVVCPSWAPILGFTGITAAVIFASTFHHLYYYKIIFYIKLHFVLFLLC